MTNLEYTLEILNRYGPDAKVTWMTVEELAEILLKNDGGFSDSYAKVDARRAKNIAAFADETERLRAEVQEREVAEWLGERTISELEAEHRDWLDEKRTQEDARF